MTGVCAPRWPWRRRRVGSAWNLRVGLTCAVLVTFSPCAVQIGESDSKFEDLVRYLNMARETLKERYIDTELVYSLAQTNLADLETFITSPNEQ